MSESKEQQWHVEPMKIHGWAIHDAEGNVVVADIYDEEIARFIIRAANAHEAAVWAIRDVRERHKAKAKACNFDDCGCPDCEALEPALALAEKESQ